MGGQERGGVVVARRMNNQSDRGFGGGEGGAYFARRRCYKIDAQNNINEAVNKNGNDSNNSSRKFADSSSGLVGQPPVLCVKCMMPSLGRHFV